MAIKKTIQNYEVLIRFQPDGKIGAHKQDIGVITDGGEPYASKLEDPVPLSLAELQALVAAWTEDDMYMPPVAKEVAE